MKTRAMSLKALFFAFCITNVSSCKLQVETRVPISSLKHPAPYETVLVAKVLNDNCNIGNGMFRIDGSECVVEREVEMELPVLKHPELSVLETSRFGIILAKNGTLVGFLNDAARKEFSGTVKSNAVSISMTLVNDTLEDVTVVLHGVWIDGRIALGIEAKSLFIRPGERITVTLSDVGKEAFFKEGIEPILVIKAFSPD